MKKISLVYTSRFLFNKGINAFSGFPGGRPEAERVRTKTEVHEAQRAETKAVYETQRDRVRALQSKKKVAGEKFEQKDARVNDNIMVIKVNGMPGRIDPMDHVKVLNGGQVYDMGGEKFVKVDVRGARGTSQGRLKETAFTAYVPLDALREPREVEATKLFNVYADEIQKHIDKVAKDRFYVATSAFTGPDGEDEMKVTIHDTEQRNRVVSWALIDASTDLNGNYLDTVGDGPSPVFKAREREFGRQSAATVVMGTSGTNPDAAYEQDAEVREGKVPEPDKRVRLSGPDTVHYSLNDAVARAQKEVSFYLKNNPSVGMPGPFPGDNDFVDDASDLGLMDPDEK